jgi:membrane-bound metal-dependent hydrolase YbcI (DUF457 family)
MLDTIILWENVFTIRITTQLYVFVQDRDLFNFDLIKFVLVIKLIHSSFVFIFCTITGAIPPGLEGKILDLSKFSPDSRTDPARVTISEGFCVFFKISSEILPIFLSFSK